MSVQTTHIQRMLTEASRLAEIAQAMTERATPCHPWAVDGGPTDGATTPQILERAANLAEHAAAELRDELLRHRDGWGFV